MDKLPNDFDWEKYTMINGDVTKNKIDAISHYLNYGIKENRLYKIDKNIIPDDFNWLEYLKVNKDLNTNTKLNSIIHYIRYGIKENRKYKYDITPMHTDTDTDLVDLENNIYDYINDTEILYTRQFFKTNPNYLKQTIDINILHTTPSFVLVIDFNNGGGGTTIFLNRIISKYKKYNTFLIVRYDGTKYQLNLNEEYLLDLKTNDLQEIINIIETFKIKCTKIFVNHLIDFNSEFIDYIFNLDKFKIGITHDYFNVLDIPQPTFKNISSIKLNNHININKYDMLITQNVCNLPYFSEYYKKKIEVVELPDFKYRKEMIKTLNDNIRCCIIGNINELKGIKQLQKITQHFNSKNVEFLLIGFCSKDININYKSYNSIDEFNKLLIDFKPNMILELTIWPETYSYTLTLSMLTELPIIYFKKPSNSVVKNRLTNYKNAFEFANVDELEKLIFMNSQNYFYTIEPIVTYSKFWNNLFIDKINKQINIENTKFKYDLKPYFIYFPQFHEIYENNENFYNGFNDIKNLQFYNNTNIIKKEILNNTYSSIENYDYVLKSDIIQKQINLIKDYGFSGLAVYYYWFSINEYTNKNMIMDKVIDKFFDNSINMYKRKVFFIWANENWTKNVALSPLDSKSILNIYDDISFKNNSINLINYFKHENYLKIDNKPVFFLYHTYLIDNIDLFYHILNLTCIENNFDGVHLVLNSFDKEYNNYKNFYINFNYKIYDSRFYDKTDNQIKLDYSSYMNNPYHSKKNKIQTIVYDFDNRVRLCNPNNLNKSTVCINNSELNKSVFTSKLAESYKDTVSNGDSELDKILLVNSLNEWGENMTFEPSDRYGYNNINLLHTCLKK